MAVMGQVQILTSQNMAPYAFCSSIPLNYPSTRGTSSVCYIRPARVCATAAEKVSDEEWRKRLSPAEYVVLRNGRTEWPWTSKLNDEKRDGVYQCAACGSELFTSETKFNSFTGWPSFFAPVENGVKLNQGFFDRLVGQREVACANCGGHLGHVFRDGPKPTGERFCINGIALRFIPKNGDDNCE